MWHNYWPFRPHNCILNYFIWRYFCEKWTVILIWRVFCLNYCESVHVHVCQYMYMYVSTVQSWIFVPHTSIYTNGSVNSRSQTTIGTKHYIYCVFFRHRLKCVVCWLLCVQTIGFFSLIFLPTKIVGFEAFKWSDRLKVCDSGNKVIVLVSILWKKLWWRSCRER